MAKVMKLEVTFITFITPKPGSEHNQDVTIYNDYEFMMTKHIAVSLLYDKMIIYNFILVIITIFILMT